jgi:biopolymer transport protein TolR
MIRVGLRRHGRHGKGGGAGGGHGPLALIPMIDMLTILVVYLLVHAADMEILPNSKNIAIPQSTSEQKPRETTVVMVTRDMLYVNGTAVLSVAELGATQTRISEPLRAALGSQSAGLLPGSEAHREVTVMAEKSLPYAVLRRIVASSSAADYTKVSFVVVEREQAYSRGATGA